MTFFEQYGATGRIAAITPYIVAMDPPTVSLRHRNQKPGNFNLQ
jgi:hypothetical protein